MPKNQNPSTQPVSTPLPHSSLTSKTCQKIRTPPHSLSPPLYPTPASPVKQTTITIIPTWVFQCSGDWVGPLDPARQQSLCTVSPGLHRVKTGSKCTRSALQPGEQSHHLQQLLLLISVQLTKSRLNFWGLLLSYTAKYCKIRSYSKIHNGFQNCCAEFHFYKYYHCCTQ